MAKKKTVDALGPSVLAHQLEVVTLDRLTPHPRNARKHADAVIDESIASNGFYKPVVASSKTGYILAGNGTYARAQAAGMAEIPVYWLHDLSTAQELKILAADNKTADASPGYDEKALAELLQTVQSEAGSFEGTGYDQDSFEAVVKAAGDAVLGPPPGDLLDPTDGEGVMGGEDGRYLRWGDKNKVAMTAEELEALNGAYERHVVEAGLSHGFVRVLLGLE